MAHHRDRQNKIARFNVAVSQRPPESVLKNFRVTPNIKNSVRRAKALSLAAQLSGAGFFIDNALREFIETYNYRVLSGNGDQQPASFNILSDFLEPDASALILRPLQEKFFSMDVNFIIENLTSTENRKGHEACELLEEEKIYHINIMGLFSDMSIMSVDGVYLLGLSAVRHDDLLSYFAVCGTHSTVGAELSSSDVSSMTTSPGREFLDDFKKSLDPTHVKIDAGLPLFQSFVAGRLDLSRKTTLVRYVMVDRKSAVGIFTDDRQIYTHMERDLGKDHGDVAGTFDAAVQMISKYSGVFALVEKIIPLATGVQDAEWVRTSRQPTLIRANAHERAVAFSKKLLSAAEAPLYIDVTTVLGNSRERSVSASIDGSEFKVEQRGYWRNLRPDQTGHDRDGAPVVGKTWVTTVESWEESLGLAPPNLAGSSVVHFSGSGSGDEGEIYIMRSAAHERDIFKVGFTTKTSDVRAKSLERTSGQPDYMLVVNTWEVENPRLVESYLHSKLQAYRLNSRREFFKIKLPQLIKIIEEGILELSSSS